MANQPSRAFAPCLSIAMMCTALSPASAQAHCPCEETSPSPPSALDTKSPSGLAMRTMEITGSLGVGAGSEGIAQGGMLRVAQLKWGWALRAGAVTTNRWFGIGSRLAIYGGIGKLWTHEFGDWVSASAMIAIDAGRAEFATPILVDNCETSSGLNFFDTGGPSNECEVRHEGGFAIGSGLDLTLDLHLGPVILGPQLSAHVFTMKGEALVALVQQLRLGFAF